MYNKTELTAKAHIELIDIAKEMGISKASRLEPQELVYKILDHQASNPVKGAEKPDENEQQKSRKRQHMKPKLLAESSMKNPEVHSRKQKIEPVKKEETVEQHEIPTLNLQISDLEMPTVPTVPEILSPSGRLLLRVDETKTQKVEE